MKSVEVTGEFLDVEGAASLLKVGEGIVRELFRQWRTTGGKTGIPHVTVGEKLQRTTREDVRRWYEKQKGLGIRMKAEG